MGAGQIIVSSDKIIIEDNKEGITAKGTRSSEFPFKKFVMCPKCEKPLRGSASRGRHGKLFPAYHCRRNGHNFRVKKRDLETQIDMFIDNLKLNPALGEHYETVMTKSTAKIKEQFGQRLKHTDKLIKYLRTELANTVSKLKLVNSTTAIKHLEADLIRIEKELVKAQACRQELADKEPNDIKNFTKKFKHILTHFDQALKNQLDPIKKAKLFGLLFD